MHNNCSVFTYLFFIPLFYKLANMRIDEYQCAPHELTPFPDIGISTVLRHPPFPFFPLSPHLPSPTVLKKECPRCTSPVNCLTKNKNVLDPFPPDIPGNLILEKYYRIPSPMCPWQSSRTLLQVPQKLFTINTVQTCCGEPEIPISYQSNGENCKK